MHEQNQNTESVPAAKAIRPSKKQRELLTYIENFIREHGYSPSYREIMHGLAYTSVATVSLHVNNLIKRGHLRKRDHSARSLEVVTPGQPPAAAEPDVASEGDKTLGAAWFAAEMADIWKSYESGDSELTTDDLHTLFRAANILGIAHVAAPYVAKLKAAAETEVAVAPQPSGQV